MESSAWVVYAGMERVKIKRLKNNDKIQLRGRKYLTKIVAIIVDAPTKAFIKCCKPSNSLPACEKCTTKSICRKQTIKRVYSDLNSSM